MSKREPCDKVLLVQAEFDGELDAAQSIALNNHRDSCPSCREAWQQLQHSRQAMRQDATYHRASSTLRSRLEEAIDAAAGPVSAQQAKIEPLHGRTLLGRLAGRQPGTRSFSAFRLGSLSFGMGAAVAAMLALLFFQPVAAVDLDDLVVASHLRSMQAGHLLDIVSTNQHNVKPWFDGKIAFAPPVKNLADQGYPLIGGRLDYLQDRDVAAVVYQAGPHTINMLVWPAPSNGAGGAGVSAGGTTAPRPTIRDGFNLIHWQERDMMIWVVSDLSAPELAKFVSTWQAHN